MDKRHNRIQWENKRTKNINLLYFVKKICDEYDEQKMRSKVVLIYPKELSSPFPVS